MTTHHQAMDKLREVLQRHHNSGKHVYFWWRDDDAEQPLEALQKLLGLSQDYGIPITLAVIPQATDNALADCVANYETVHVAVHGWSHTNYAALHEKKQELGLHRPRSEVCDELRLGFEKLSRLYEKQFVAMLVPPWNRIAAPVVGDLSALGFQALSVFGDKCPASIPTINTHIDIIDWHGTRGGLGIEALCEQIIDQVQVASTPLGLLTHHLVHDAAAWKFLDLLFATLCQSPAVTWCSSRQLMQLQQDVKT